MSGAHPQSTALSSAQIRAPSLVDALADLGERYDAAPVFPIESMKLLRSAGLLQTFAPVEAGGAPFADRHQQYANMLSALRVVGRGDLSVGRLFEGHVNALLLFDWFGTRAQRIELRHKLNAGAMYGVWATEPPPGVQLLASRSGWTLAGTKSFATGAGCLAHAIITVQPAAGQRRLVIADAGDPDRTDLSEWRVRGMRATGSGRYDLSGMPVSSDALLGAPGDYDRGSRREDRYHAWKGR